ncbi:UDP-N-acetylmuramate dehydrogenase [Dethiobacter alkaliphilus]|uniref:UDP-N-acetylmuramate dehydrogenase n=1 Tax=Dethiobacter alkaliphilus TaxID=427926 RepID=UPI002226B1C2|nr:UDP-N-acetylmuramate dehydrogenase [Dethiobacter alkaliphilus]MCW3491233.1 UDP-N-acetylmuramate dehydrogenase [Dethiobacter alkaliphilus]
MKDIAQRLAAEITGDVKTAEPMSKHTTFKIGGPADLFVEPQTTEDLIRSLEFLRGQSIPVFVMGNGSNLLVSDSGYRGAVIRLAGEFLRTDYGPTTVDAGAAVSLPKLAREASARGLGGLEFAAGIPATIGGALMMNAGAHGCEIGGVIAEAEILDTDLKVHTLRHKDLGLSYRRSNLAPGAVVCRVRLELEPGESEALLAKCHHNLQVRRERQPRLPNAGSIFKNPPEDAAGRLIDAAGLKGRRSGGAMISEVHANFIVNCGNATAEDVCTLINMAKTAVAEQFGMELKLEVRLLGY